MGISLEQLTNSVNKVMTKVKDKFVSKEEGKGLSTNDYSTEDKSKVAKIDDIENSIEQVNSQIDEKANLINARIDTFAKLEEGSTTADAELKDIRVGADGTTYENAGNAVREQFNELKEGLADIKNGMTDIIGKEPPFLEWVIGAISGTGENNDNSRIRMRTNNYIFLEKGHRVIDTMIGNPSGYGMVVYQYNVNKQFKTYTSFNNPSAQTFTASEDMYVRLVLSQNNLEFTEETLTSRALSVSFPDDGGNGGRLGEVETSVSELQKKTIKITPTPYFTWERGGINASNGLETTIDTSIRTSLFFVPKGTAFFTNFFGVAYLTCQFRGIIEYDSNGNFIENHTVKSPHFMYFAEHDMYVRVCAGKYSNGFVVVDDDTQTFIEENVHIVSKNTASKLVYILGDSWTEQQRYVDELVRMTGIDFVNYGVTSSQITNDKGETKLSFVTRARSMDTTKMPDVIIIEGGINDWIGNVTIGTLEEITRDSNGEIIVNSLMSAEANIIEYIQKTWNDTEILFVTNSNSYWQGTNIDATKPMTNINGDTPFDFANATEKVCENYSIPCVNLAKLCHLNGDNMAKNGNYMPDYLHPSTGIASKRVARPIAEKLSMICIE